MSYHILKLSICLLLFPTLGTTQSLIELLDIAKNNSLELKALQQEYRAALEIAPQVSQLPDPEVGLGGFILPVETRLGAQNARLSISQMSPWFGTLGAKAEVATTNALALYERVASRELELSYTIKAAYFKLYELEQSQSIIQRNISLLRVLRQLALSNLENGKGNAADVLRVDLKIEELEEELNVLEQNKTKPLVEINQIINRPLTSPISIQDSLPFAVLTFNKDTLGTYIRGNHPMIRMFSLQQESAQKKIALNKLAGKPSFGVGMDYILVSPRSDATPINNGKDVFQVSAKMSIPIYRKKFKAKDQEEYLKIEALENRKSDTETLFLAMIEQAYTEHATAGIRQDLYTRQIETTRRVIQILSAEYSTSGGRFDELLLLEMDLVNYDLKILKAIIQSQLAKARIERYIAF